MIGDGGRVLFFNTYSGNWSTICDDYWNDVTATVVCKHMGMGNKGIATSRQRDYNYHSSGFSINCIGFEADINECSHYENSYCYAGVDIAVECMSNFTDKSNFTHDSNSTDGSKY